MKKSEGIQVVQGDRYEADVTITGREFIDAYFCLSIDSIEPGYVIDSYDDKIVISKPGGSTFNLLNAQYKTPAGKTYPYFINIKMDKDSSGKCSLNLPGFFTNIIKPGKYTYNISVTIDTTTTSYYETLTPIYTNLFEVLPPVNPFLYGAERG